MVSLTSSYRKAVILLLVIVIASVYYGGVKLTFIKMPEMSVSFKKITKPPEPESSVKLKATQPTKLSLNQDQMSPQSKEKTLSPPAPCLPISTSSTTKKTGKTRKADGIIRSVDEQRIEAIEILSLAVESAVAKNRKSFANDRKCDWTDGTWAKDTSIKRGEGVLKGYQKCRIDYRQNCKRNNANAPYLSYRWILNDPGCEAKRVRFTRELFLSTVRNKRIVFIGDSLTRNMFQSLACLLHVPGDKAKMIEDNIYRYRYPNFGVTIEFIVSNYLVKQTRPTCDSNATLKLAKQPCLDVKNVDEKWAGRVSEFDIFIFATGGWWEHDLQMRQVLGGDRSYRTSRAVMRQALSTVMNYLGRPEFKEKELYWRCSEVSHFFGGEWNSGGKCLKQTPSKYSIYNAVSLFIQEAVIDSLSNTSSNIRLLDITKMSSFRQDAHPSSQTSIGGRTDCKHWCLPGVPDHWNEILLNMLKEKEQDL